MYPWLILEICTPPHCKPRKAIMLVIQMTEKVQLTPVFIFVGQQYLSMPRISTVPHISRRLTPAGHGPTPWVCLLGAHPNPFFF